MEPAVKVNQIRGKLNGVQTFGVVWVGQLISTIGSGLTGFALGIWIFEETGSSTLFALNILAFTLPTLLVSPLAGALVDRWDRRIVMILSDTGAGLSTLAVWILYITGNLQVWHIYAATVFNAAFTTFQWPAYSAATTLLVPKKHLGRASGMVQIGDAISSLLSPTIAGFLYILSGLKGVLLIDFITFIFAVTTLGFVHFPSPKKSEQLTAGKKSSLFEEAAFGWKYITARKGLFGLLIFFASLNFLGVMISPLIVPLLLGMTGADTMGVMFSLVGLGMLAGTLTMSAWGGPKRRIVGIILPSILQSFGIIMMGLRPSLILIGVSGFIFMFFNPILNGSSQALWQSKVAPDIQGRVFAVRRMIAMAIQPLGLLVVGPLSDYIFEPLMAENGALAGSVGKIIGVGPGRGIGLFFIVIGIFTLIISILAYLQPRIRNVQEELPDVVEDEPDTKEPELVEFS